MRPRDGRRVRLEALGLRELSALELLVMVECVTGQPGLRLVRGTELGEPLVDRGEGVGVRRVLRRKVR